MADAVQSTPKYLSVQILRAVAALLVVAWHSPLSIKFCERGFFYEFEKGELFRAVNYPFFLNHLNLGVDVFFCISGFIMAMLAATVTRSTQNLLAFFFRRVIRVYPMYWVFTLVVVAGYLASNGKLNMGGLTGEYAIDFPRFIYSALLMPRETTPVLGVGWTLVYEMQFYLVCSISLLFVDGRRLVYILGGLAAISIVEMLWVDSSGHIFPALYYLEFFAGALAYRCRSLLSPRNATVGVILGGGIFLGLSYLLDWLIINELTHYKFMMQILLASIGGFVLIVSLVSMRVDAFVQKNVVGRLLLRVGDSSYVLYLSHWFVLSLTGKVVVFCSGANPLAVMGIQVLSIASSVVVGVVISEFFEMKLQRNLAKRVTLLFPFSK